MCAGIASGPVALFGLSFNKRFLAPDVSMVIWDMVGYELLVSLGMVLMSSFVDRLKMFDFFNGSLKRSHLI